MQVSIRRQTYQLQLYSGWIPSGLENIGVDPSKFGLHSLRLGGATSAANNGINDRIFQRHGRWKLAEAKNIYVDHSIEQRLTVSKRLGL